MRKLAALALVAPLLVGEGGRRLPGPGPGPGRLRLHLLVSALSDTFAGMISRTPGVITIGDTRAHLPLLSP